MNKIGIITSFGNINYGSNLQAFALQEVIEGLNYEVELIPNLAFIKNINSPLVHFKKQIIDIVFLRYKGLIFRRSFYKFISTHLNIAKYTCDNLSNKKELQDEYYKFVCGSDQIWSPFNFNKNNFLDFVIAPEKKIAFSPSIGAFTIPPELREKYRFLLNDFKKISVREKTGAVLLNKLTGKKIISTVDPTLLLRKAEWEKYCAYNKVPEKPYLLSFFLGSNKKHREQVKKLCKNMKLKQIILPLNKVDLKEIRKCRFNVSPNEFLGLIQNASLVCTDSYHGMLFSIIFNTNFQPFLRFSETDKLNQNSRVLDLLNSINLEKLLHIGSKLDNNNIPWETINKIVLAEREKSLSFLLSSLSDKH